VFGENAGYAAQSRKKLRGTMVNCPICRKRKATRFCPAKGEQICAICCGTEREVTISCPADCGYLVAAHRYEDQHKRSVPADTPFVEERVPQSLPHAQQQLITMMAYQIAKFAGSEKSTADPDVLAALVALAQTYKTLQSGLLYERVPEVPAQRDLYLALTKFLDDVKRKVAEGGNPSAATNIDIFHVTIFLYRMGLVRSNGRPRSRRFIEFLRAQFPVAEEAKPEEPRIIVP
jgi:hypothetical protein